MFDRIEDLERKVDKLMLDISALTAAVANETTVEAGAVTLINGFAAQLSTLIAQSGDTVDPVALQAIVTTMTANNTNLSNAVATNTPAATPATPSVAAVQAAVRK